MTLQPLLQVTSLTVGQRTDGRLEVHHKSRVRTTSFLYLAQVTTVQVITI